MRVLQAWCALSFGLLGTAAIVAACSGGEGSPPSTAPDGAPLPPPGAPGTPGALPPAQPIPREQLAAEMAKVACEPLPNCCQAAGLEYVAGACAAALAGDAGAVFNIQSPPPGDTSSTYDPQAAGECVQYYRETMKALEKACAEPDPVKGPDQSQAAYQYDLTLQYARHLGTASLGFSACSRIFTGPKAPGEKCAGVWECQGVLEGKPILTRSCRRQSSGQSNDSVCELSVLVGENEPCVADAGSVRRYSCAPTANVDPTTHHPDDRFYCAPDTNTCKREREVEMGGACADDGTFCPRFEQNCRSSDRTCQPHLADGADCLADNDCRSDYCPQSTKKCTARKALGSPCEDDRECLSNQCANIGKTCVRFPSLRATPLTCSGKTT